MVKANDLIPPDPRPWKAEPQKRQQRKQREKQAGGFDWGETLALGLIGATVVFGIDKSLRRAEEKHEEEERRGERRRQTQARSRRPNSSRSQASRDRDDGANGYAGDERKLRDDQGDEEEDYHDRDWDEREYRSVRDYACPKGNPFEPRARIRAGSVWEGGVRDQRGVDRVEKFYAYDGRCDEHKQSRSNPVCRSREQW